MRELLSTKLRRAASLAHIWWGVSVEDRQYGLPRIQDLRATAARVRFLSVEPLLEDVGKLPLRGIQCWLRWRASAYGIPCTRPMKTTR